MPNPQVGIRNTDLAYNPVVSVRNFAWVFFKYQDSYRPKASRVLGVEAVPGVQIQTVTCITDSVLAGLR